MKRALSLRLVLVLFGILLITLIGTGAATIGDGDESEDDEAAPAHDDQNVGQHGLVEENPNYSPFSTKENTSDDERDTSDSENEESDAKESMNSELEKTKPRSLPRKVTRFLKQHHLKILIVVALHAFRNEIAGLIRFSVRKHLMDPSSERLQKPSVTAILKILVFLEIMRRVVTSNGSAKPTPFMSAMLFRTNPVLGVLLSGLLQPGNTAYIPPIRQHYTFERVNERYTRDGMALRKAISPERMIQIHRRKVFTGSPASKPSKSCEFNSTVIIMDLTGLDSSMSQLSSLQDQVNFLIKEHRANTLQKTLGTSEKTEMEVVIKLESPGGSAADYALAAAQLMRLRKEEGITVTIIVDKVAASGGYMMACVASPGSLIAAPFAVVGSIGVIGQTFNIHETLEGWGVKPLVFRGGKDKAPVGLVGEVTEEGLQKVQQMVDDTHRAFKRHVAAARPIIADDIDKYATGQVWLGYDAVAHGLVDRLSTSDEYLDERMSEGARVLRILHLTSPRYPFQPPATAASIKMDEAPSFSQSVNTIAASFHAFVGSLRQLLGFSGPIDNKLRYS